MSPADWDRRIARRRRIIGALRQLAATHRREAEVADTRADEAEQSLARLLAQGQEQER